MPDKFAQKLPHGGDLQDATAVFGKPKNPWQDLSTGISPWGYPAANIPAFVWRDLPSANGPLCHSAAQYYQTLSEFIVPVPGSQFAISQLPSLVAPATVALPTIGYAEHARAWQLAGHTMVQYQSIGQLCALAEQGHLSHAVIISPNNPTGELCPLETIEFLHRTLPGVVVLDEAFIDALAKPSAAVWLAQLPRLCVLRSVGKFFGLAGIRLGFLLNSGEFAQRLRQKLPPWSVNHPAQWLGARALQDSTWQLAQSLRIRAAEQQLIALFKGFVGTNCTLASGGLFVTLRGPWPYLMALYQGLAKQGIYTRWCHWPAPTVAGTDAWLRVGLACDGGARLRQALTTINL